jgi:hypothetical protein
LPAFSVRVVQIASRSSHPLWVNRLRHRLALLALPSGLPDLLRCQPQRSLQRKLRYRQPLALSRCPTSPPRQPTLSLLRPIKDM